MSNSVSLDKTEQFFQKIDDLKKAMTERAPQWETMLRTIHTNLKADPDVVTLLTPEQIGVIVAGLSQKKGIVLAAAAGKGKTATGKRLKEVDIGDLV